LQWKGRRFVGHTGRQLFNFAWLNYLVSTGRKLTLAVGFLAAILLTFIWAGTVARVSVEEAFAVENSLADSKNIALIVAVRLDEVVARSLLYAEAGRALLHGEPTRTDDFSLRDPAYLRFAVFNDKGRLAYSSSKRQAEPELTMLLNAVAGARLGDLISIGRPSPGVDDSAWRVPLAVCRGYAEQGGTARTFEAAASTLLCEHGASVDHRGFFPGGVRVPDAAPA
jgi:hypothetical protein